MKVLLTPWRRLLAEREFVILLISQLVLGMAYSFVVPFYSMFGTIEVGNPGDLAVLDRDYFTIPDDDIKKIRSLLTIVGGRIMYNNGVA